MGQRVWFHHAGSGGSGSGSMLLVTPARVGIVVDPGVPGEFVGTAEAL